MSWTADKQPDKSPEQTMQYWLNYVIDASAHHIHTHVTNSYTHSPGQSAIVICGVTCPDDMAKELHEKLDGVVREVFAEHGMKSTSLQ